MIGVDTNVLARLFLQDDEKQTRLAQQFFAKRSAEDPAFISVAALVEFIWLLTSRYKYPVEAVYRALGIIFVSANVRIEQEEMVKAAVYLAEKTGADIPDAIIAAVAGEHECSATVTFDRNAAKRVPGMELLA